MTAKLAIPESDVLVIGSGPNGLAAAITMAQAGCSVTLVEAASTIGGGTRTEELTLPGFHHDVCSAVHPFAASSPFFSSLPLERYGLEWVYPPAALAHPFDDGSAAVLERQVEATAATLGEDAEVYRRFITPMLRVWEKAKDDALAPIRFPQHPFASARFGVHALRSAEGFAESLFKGDKARAFFAGSAAHAMLPLEALSTASFGLVLLLAGHTTGFPIARGGSQVIANALARHLESLRGKIVCGMRVESLEQLPPAKAILADVTPRQLLQLAGSRLPTAYRKKLERFRYGTAAFKMDWALDRPIPWNADECRRSATVHLGGSFDEVATSERVMASGVVSAKPFVILAQPSLFDGSRAPAGKHTAWAYCHVPLAYASDISALIESQIERFAPGFRKSVIGRSVLDPAALQRHNPNLVGGSIHGGAMDLSQLFFRPTRSMYATPAKGLYLCSASTPPGGGVHGLCGYYAARLALKQRF
jgi:phytoene dehydrogenase-like protein